MGSCPEICCKTRAALETASPDSPTQMLMTSFSTLMFLITLALSLYIKVSTATNHSSTYHSNLQIGRQTILNLVLNGLVTLESRRIVKPVNSLQNYHSDSAIHTTPAWRIELIIAFSNCSTVPFDARRKRHPIPFNEPLHILFEHFERRIFPQNTNHLRKTHITSKSHEK